MSNTTRPFNVIRRRSRLLDILIPKNPLTQKYRLLAKATFDGAFTQIIEADIGSGFLDPALRTSGKVHTLQAVNTRGFVRISFDPETFAAAATISDSAQFWLKFQPVDFAGAAGTQTPPTLILPEDSLSGDSVVVIGGTAPNGATVANSQILYLPLRMQDISVRNNEGATDLFVATEVGGAELFVEAGPNNLSVGVLPRGAQGCLLVRGGGGTASFTASMTSFLPL